MRIFCMSARDVDECWNDIQPLLEQFAQSTGETKPDQIRTGALNSMLQVWGLQDQDRVHGVLVTEVIESAWDHICVIRVAAGEVRLPLQERLLDEVGKWAREIGCRRVRFVGRHGWLKRFKRFRPRAVVGEWDLSH